MGFRGAVTEVGEGMCPESRKQVMGGLRGSVVQAEGSGQRRGEWSGQGYWGSVTPPGAGEGARTHQVRAPSTCVCMYMHAHTVSHTHTADRLR